MQVSNSNRKPQNGKCQVCSAGSAEAEQQAILARQHGVLHRRRSSLHHWRHKYVVVQNSHTAEPIAQLLLEGKVCVLVWPSCACGIEPC